MWDMAQLAPRAATETPLDYLSEFVLIFPDISVGDGVRLTHRPSCGKRRSFSRRSFCSRWKRARRRKRRSLGSFTISLERLLFFVIKRLGRQSTARLLVMVVFPAFSDAAARPADQSAAEPVAETPDRTWSWEGKWRIENRFFGCTVVSRACWPAMEELRLELPETVAVAQKRVERFFKKAFPRRELQLMPNLGKVEMEVAVAGETRAFCCSPVQFAVLQYFCGRRVCWLRVTCRLGDGRRGLFRLAVSARRCAGGDCLLDAERGGSLREGVAANVSSRAALRGEGAGNEE